MVGWRGQLSESFLVCVSSPVKRGKKNSWSSWASSGQVTLVPGARVIELNYRYWVICAKMVKEGLCLIGQVSRGLKSKAGEGDEVGIA